MTTKGRRVNNGREGEEEREEEDEDEVIPVREKKDFQNPSSCCSFEKGLSGSKGLFSIFKMSGPDGKRCRPGGGGGGFSFDVVLWFWLNVLLWSPSLAVKQSHFIHWNTSNPIFRIDNTDHIIDVNRGNQPWEYDQVNIICPLYRPEEGEAHRAEKYIIYSVTREEYESCRIMSTNPRVIAQCTRPHELMYFTITFRSFTPTPGGMEFKPGRNYYFISTSSHSDVDRRVGGRCSTHNMKVQFKVADNQHESPPSRTINHPRLRGRRPLPPSRSSSTSTTTTTTTEATTERSNSNPYIYGKLPRYYGDLSYYPVYEDEGEEQYSNDEGGSNGGHYYYGGGSSSSSSSNNGREDVRRGNSLVKHEASRMASR